MARQLATFWVRLHGTQGWSKSWTNKLAAHRIHSHTGRKRLFRLFDRHRPYTLDVHYEQPKVESGGLLGLFPVYNPRHVSHMTFRYKTEQDMINDRLAIASSQNAYCQQQNLQVLVQRMRDDVREWHSIWAPITFSRLQNTLEELSHTLQAEQTAALERYGEGGEDRVADRDQGRSPVHD